MATFKATIIKNRKSSDKKWRVYIRFTYERKVRYIPTQMYVAKEDLTTSLKIKNQLVLDKCEEIIRVWRERVYSLNLELKDVEIEEIIKRMTQKEEPCGICISAFFDTWAKQKERAGLKNYMTAMNAFKKFIGRDIVYTSDITVASMRDFERSLNDKPRAQSQYTNAIVKIFRDARDYYNDEDSGIIRIKHTLKKYNPPRQNVSKKRALTVEQIRTIFNMDYDNLMNKGLTSRHDLALDCFKLSFCLMGMNSADMHSADTLKDGHIIYNRKKTRNRRSDGAEMRIRISAYISDLVEKYKDKDGKKVFNFYKRFKGECDLNRAINIGLKEIGAEIGIENLQFYSARHSMATIAINNVGINKWLVNEMLCHTDESMKVTDLYITKDFTPINNANKQLLDYVFGEY